MKKRFCQEEITYLQENYRTLGAIACAEQLKRSVFYIRKKAQALGLRLSSDERKSLRQKEYAGHNAQAIPMGQFEKINSKYVPYFLGLLWADGHVAKTKNRISLACHEKDGQTIQKVCNQIGEFHVCRPQKRAQYIFYISHSQFHKWLVAQDFQNKSTNSPTKILSCIPMSLHKYFWRGFFDGDGCLYKGRCGQTLSFTGHFNQNWSDLQTIIEQTTGQAIKILRRPDDKRGHKSSVAYLYERNAITNFFEYIYPDKIYDFGLHRKYEKLLQVSFACKQPAT